MKFSMKAFYTLGIVCWGIVVLMGVINFFLFFSMTYLTTKIANLANLIFNIGIIALFVYLRKQLKFNPTSEEDMEEILKGK